MAASVRTLARYVRRLDEQSLAALVADLYAARGWTASVEDGRVVASRDGETRTVAVRATPRWRPWARVPSPDQPVDEVVTAGGAGDRVTALADREGVRLRDGTDVAKMLRYAVDAATTATLCERHLGRSPSAMRPAPTRRLRRRVRHEYRRLAGTTPPATGVAGAVALVAVLALVATVSGVGIQSPGETAATPTSAGTPTPAATPTPVGNAPSVYEYEFLSDGSVSVDALAAAHQRVLQANSYRQSTVVVRRDATATGDSRVQVKQLWLRKRGARYLIRTRRTVCGGPMTAAEFYFDGSDLYRVRYANGSTSYERFPGYQREPGPPASSSRRTAVKQYLDVGINTTVEFEENGDEVTVVGTGNPESLSALGVRNYTVTARVTEAGLVRYLKVGYHRGGGTNWTAIGQRYTDVGATALWAPNWYERRTNATGEGWNDTSGRVPSTFARQTYQGSRATRQFCRSVPDRPTTAVRWLLPLPDAK